MALETGAFSYVAEGVSEGFCVFPSPVAKGSCRSLMPKLVPFCFDPFLQQGLGHRLRHGSPLHGGKADAAHYQSSICEAKKALSIVHAR